MTNKVQKIREEVERLKSQLLRGACSSQIAMETRCKEEAYNEVLAILDTMQEQHKETNFLDYFDRGIGLCDEWKNSFISFRDWSINNGYDDKLTLDRIDNDGSYTPENCRWVDMKVQSNNRSNNISVRIEEGCIPFSEICRVLSIDYMYAYNKVVKHLSQEIDVQRYVKNWKEPVSDDLEEEIEKYMNALYRNWTEDERSKDSDVEELCKQTARYFANWQKTKDESTTEDLGDYINELSKQFPEVSFAKLSRIAVRVAKWKEQQDKKKEL